MRRFCRLQVTALLGLLLTAGCAGYRLGPTSGVRAGDPTIQIVPFANRTLEPRLGDAVTSALRQELQRDGTYQLVTREPGFVIVTGEITRYQRQELSFLRSDVVTAKDYRVGLTAKVIARERLTDRVLLEREFTGNTLMRVSADLPSVERQTLPVVAADLARQIAAALADGAW